MRIVRRDDGHEEGMTGSRIPGPYPYHGAKDGDASAIIWDALGDCPNVVDAFFGGGRVLLNRPADHERKIETANDACGFIPNAWRAIQKDPEAVAEHCAWPVSELDLHARHVWLVEQMGEAFVERLRSDPDFFDARIAGWWIWGICIWIGGGWCDSGAAGRKKKPALAGHGSPSEKGRPMAGRGVMSAQLPQLSGSDGTGVGYGCGINRGRLPHLAGPANPGGKGVGHGRGIFSSRVEELSGYFRLLQKRFIRTRFTCGDFRRVLTPTVTTSHGRVGIVLDPPYGAAANRCKRLYAVDDLDIAVAARDWAIEHGEDERYRIVLCGYEGEHEGKMPESWRCAAWKSHSGYASAGKERIWLSPHCSRDVGHRSAGWWRAQQTGLPGI